MRRSDRARQHVGQRRRDRKGAPADGRPGPFVVRSRGLLPTATVAEYERGGLRLAAVLAPDDDNPMYSYMFDKR
jgi:hypothetical protein